MANEGSGNKPWELLEQTWLGLEPPEEHLIEILRRHKKWSLLLGQGEIADLRGADLSRKDLPEVYLPAASLQFADFSRSNLIGADLTKARLSNAKLDKSDLSGASLVGGNLKNARLEEADCSNADLSKSNLFRADLSEADLRDSSCEEANLSQVDLSDADLGNATLEGAVLRGADLSNTDIADANLSGTILEGARLLDSEGKRVDLSDANLKGAIAQDINIPDVDLTAANLEEANLRNSDLRDANGLQVQAVARANVSNANLPDEVAEFDGLMVVEEASRSARRLFIALGLACAYAALAISTKTSGEGTLTLPFIEVDLFLWDFYVVTPVLLGLSYGYFHLQMQRVWGEMSRLPAVFPDGKAIDQKIHPWLVTGLARAHVPFLRDNPVPLFPLQKLVVIVLAWGTVPLTQAYFVGSFVKQFPEHALLSGLGAALVAATLGGAVVSYRTAKAHLRGEYEGPFRPFANENNEDVRRWPDWQTVFWAAEWTLTTFALWIWWTFVYLGH